MKGKRKEGRLEERKVERGSLEGWGKEARREERRKWDGEERD